MNLSNLRNPLPNIRKAYSSNFSNTANESSDEKGAAELNEWVGALLRLLVKAAGTGVRGARGVGKVVAPLVAPDVVDVVTMDDTAHAPMLLNGTLTSVLIRQSHQLVPRDHQHQQDPMV